MKVKVRGKEIVLDKRHYISAGGEGQIYAKNNMAYKIYIKSSHIIPESKIGELSVLKIPSIIKPIDIVQNSSGKNIGYTMKYIKKTVGLCQLFTKAFKTRNNLKDRDILSLVNQLRDGIKHCHDNNILIVDLNEFNFLVDDSKFNEIYFIDVDSYQTPHYPATAIMDSIRDRQTKKWTTDTDWFSFGILSFQLFIGIHPFRGKHPVYKTMDDRMLNNVSVFNKDVKVPPVTMSFNSIPDAYKQWYTAIFDAGRRIAPPFGDTAVSVAYIQPIKVIRGNDNFIIDLMKEYDGDIIHYIDGNILTEKGLVISSRMDTKVAPYSHIVIRRSQQIYTVIIQNRKLMVYNVFTGKDVDNHYEADQIMSYNGRVYIKYESNIYEVGFIEMNNSVSLKIICSILPQATQMFEGVVIQNLLGSYYVSIFPEQGLHYQIKIDELEGCRLIDAVYKNKVLILVGEKNGGYSQFIFKFNSSYNRYLVRKISPKQWDYTGINFTVLDNGVCVFETHEGYIELFRNDLDNQDIKLIEDTALAGSRLFHDGNRVLFSKDNKLYSVRLK